MGVDTAIEFTDSLLYERTGQHLSDLQCCILQHVWGGKTYRAIATLAGYSEGHIKDVASHLWRLLSDVLGERITKGNCRSRLVFWLKRAKHKVVHKVAHVADRVSPPVTSPPQATLPLVTSPQSSTTSTFSSSNISPTGSSHLSDGIDPYFIGRSEAIRTLDTLSNQGHNLISIQGEGGVGKTTLAQHYLHHRAFDVVLEWRIAQEVSSLSAGKHILDEWLQHDLADQPGQDLTISLSRLKRHLKQKRIGILIDNLEPALDSTGQFVSAARGYAELLALLGDSSHQATTLLTSRDRLCEPGIKATHYRLPQLALIHWQQYFRHHKVDLSATDEILSHLHRLYSGNAKAMEILCHTVQADFDSNIAAYWQTYGSNPLVELDLKNLAVCQIDRLQRLDPDAYQLLCRLSCDRYQMIAKLSISAVLAQSPSQDGQRAVTSLRNCSLLNVDRGQYWLHPIVQAVAIERLRQNDAWWQQAHQAAADH